jgi:hypothetical protein
MMQLVYAGQLQGSRIATINTVTMQHDKLRLGNFTAEDCHRMCRQHAGSRIYD